jgi:para-aminobenzoate synthetase/4-amino-4-deoxychorismate lyase
MVGWHSAPEQLYSLVEHTPGTVLLECSKPGAAEPWTRLFTAPARVISANRPAEIPALFAEIESAVAAGHFAAGFFAYEAGACFEPTAELLPSRPGLPLAWFGIYENCHRFDHQTGAFAEGDPPGLSRFAAEIRDDQPSQEAQPEAIFSLSEQEYSQRVAAIHAWIRAGDVYQLNFTAPFEVQASGSPAALYARLRSRQPVEFGAFLHGNPEHRILSFSPELFFRLEGRGAQRRIRTRPMKGTAPRGRTTREDRQQAEWLRHDPKNRSENVMIVDLLRNDLGRLCAFGSVRVESLFAVERYSTLWQMTSTVAGELRPDVRFEEIFRALFPCGSITGAPKVRAMQLLSRIEQQPRGIYTGAIGFFSREQTVFNVAIRTLELEEPCGQSDRQRGVMGVGGGIVADSEAGEEFRECRLKAEFLTGASDVLSQKFSLVETMLWREGYPLIELHLDRLEDSAGYFGFACDRAEVRAALMAHAATFASPEPSPKLSPEPSQSPHQPPKPGPRKVRLLLDPEGGLRIESEILPESAVSPAAKPVRIRISAERTDPRDRMLFHKTTHRPVYAAAFKAATEAGFDDVLFLNLRGEVTEGAISNIFIEKDGRWFTPPVECGLLAGVFRRHLLELRPGEQPLPGGEQDQVFAAGVQERVLYPGDLRQAGAVYLTNAVRGLRRAIIDWENQQA